MIGGWSRIDRRAWDLARECIARDLAGSRWPDELIAADAAATVDAERHDRAPAATVRELASRWGVGKNIAHRVISAARAAQPDSADGAETAGTAAGQSGTRSGQAGTNPGQTARANADNPGASGTARDKPGTARDKPGTEPPKHIQTAPLSAPREREREREREDQTECVPPAVAVGDTATDGPDKAPDWARGVRGVRPLDVVAGVTRAVTAIRGAPTTPSRATAAPVISLWRALAGCTWAEFVADVEIVADACHRSPARLFARDVRAEGWPGGVDRSRDVATVTRHARWQARVDVARAWRDREAGRGPVVASSGRDALAEARHLIATGDGAAAVRALGLAGLADTVAILQNAGLTDVEIVEQIAG